MDYTNCRKYRFDWSGFTADDLAKVNQEAKYVEDDIYGVIFVYRENKGFIVDIHYEHYSWDQRGFDLEIYRLNDDYHGEWLGSIKDIKSANSYRRFCVRAERLIIKFLEDLEEEEQPNACMTDVDREDLLYDINEYLCMVLKCEYEDEDDFKEKFGPTDTLEDAAELLRNVVEEPRDMLIFNQYMDAFPGSKDELMELFGVEEKEDTEESRPYSLWGRIGMSIRLTEDEHTTISKLLEEGKGEEASAMIFTLFKMRGVFDGDSYVPEECLEEVFGENNCNCEISFDF